MKEVFKIRRVIAFFIILLLFACSRNQQPDNIQSKETETETEIKTEIKTEKKTNISSTPINNGDDAKQEVILDVPIISQNPELKYGCEVTSLTMLLQHAGIKVDKMKLAKELPKDKDPLLKSETGNITRWGDPNDGFVGDITGKNSGYAVYDKPLENLMKQYLPDRTLNLTGKNFDDLLNQLKAGKPVVVWTTGDYKLPDRWEAWKHGNEVIKTPLDLHAVVLVGFDSTHVYVNDPLSGKKAHKVDRKTFEKSWIALGKQALTYK